MPRLRLFHWRAAEAAPLITALKAAGYQVDYDQDFASFRKARQSPPEAFVIDLTRMPSYGREVAVALRGSPATRGIPLVFAGGDPEKVAAVKRLIPDAAYTSHARLPATLRRAKPPADPVVPTRMMDRWAGRSIAQKLGITRDARVAVIDPPADYARAIGDLPEGASYEEGSSEESPPPDCKIALWFVRDIAALQAALPNMRRTAGRSRVWILWRKGSINGLNGQVIRESANSVGLVDYKICSVNQTWSGMVFTVKKAR
jgi:hypothetical protein